MIKTYSQQILEGFNAFQADSDKFREMLSDCFAAAHLEAELNLRKMMYPKDLPLRKKQAELEDELFAILAKYGLKP